MTKKEMTLEYLEKNNGMITYKDCKRLGIPTIYLTRLESEGIIFRIEKGIYLTPYGDYDEYYFFQYRFSKAIFSYISALHLQGFTDEIPQYFEVSIPRGYRFNNPPSNLRHHIVSKKFIDMGIINVKTPWQNEVKVYDFERTVCDFIINRKKIDPELFVKTLQTYGNFPKKNISKLYDYAERMDIVEETKRTLEVLL